jgi:hypothetical protein
MSAPVASEASSACEVTFPDHRRISKSHPGTLELPMTASSAADFGGRDRRRLQLAREKGYLDARCASSPKLLRAHGKWCWRLKLPMVWFERHTPHSRFGRVYLELFTTPNTLTAAGQAELQELATRHTGSRVQVTPNDARWERIRLDAIEKLANAVFRATVRVGNYRLTAFKLPNTDAATPGKLIRMLSRRASA